MKIRSAMPSCIVVTVVLFLFGCSGPRSIQRELISYRDLPTKVQIIGRLGYPLGTYLVIRGSWAKEDQRLPSKTARGPWSFHVTHINGNPVNGDVRFDRIDSFGDSEEAEKVDGRIWELRGFETGGFMYTPGEVVKEMFKVMPPFQNPAEEYRFETKFAYFWCRLLDHP